MIGRRLTRSPYQQVWIDGHIVGLLKMSLPEEISVGGHFRVVATQPTLTVVDNPTEFVYRTVDFRYGLAASSDETWPVLIAEAESLPLLRTMKAWR